MVVPVLDLSPMFGGTAAEKKQLALQLKKTMEEVGFFQIKGHQFPEGTLQDLFQKSKDFFDLPEQAKKETPMTPDYPYGYEAAEVLSKGWKEEEGQDDTTANYSQESSGASTDAPSSPDGSDSSKKKVVSEVAQPDMKETFQFTLHPMHGEPKFPREELFVKTTTSAEGAVFTSTSTTSTATSTSPPAAAATFKSACVDYYEQMFVLAKVLLQVFAHALELPDEDWFLKKVNEHQSACRILNYPHLDAYEAGRVRASPHTDYGILTILKQDTTGGLEVKADHDGEEGSGWVAVKPQKDTFVVNIGDLMQRWTNDKWKSTIHRVVAPTIEPGRSNRRQSVAFFFNANADARIETFPSCLDAGGATKYGAVIAGEYLMSKHSKANA